MVSIRKERKDYIVSFNELRKLNTLYTHAVREQLSELIEKKGIRIYVDLSGVKFIDSAGFSMLKEINRKASAKSSELILCNLSPEVHELLQLPDVPNHFSICNKKIEKEKARVSVR